MPGRHEIARLEAIAEPPSRRRMLPAWELVHSEIVWTSAWGSKAHRLLGPILDVPQFPFVPFPPIPFDPVQKIPSVAEYVGSRAAAWVDDVLVPEAWEWAAQREFTNLLVPVDPRVGLELEHVCRIRSWSSDLDGRP